MLEGDTEEEMVHFGSGLKCDKGGPKDKEGSIPCFEAW